MIIREMRNSDFSQIMEIENNSYASPEASSVLNNKWKSDSKYCFVVESNSVVAGFIIAYPAYKDHVAKLHCEDTEDILNEGKESLYIHDIAISSEFKGVGIGSQLCDHVWDLAKKSGLNYTHLVAVNKSAESFWHNRGYLSTKTVTTVYGYTEDAVVMQRKL